MKTATTEPVTDAMQETETPAEPRQTEKPHVEYSVYIYHHQENDREPARWEKMHSTHFVDQAIKRAKILYKSDQYAKVEVKKKSINHRNQSAKDQTYRTYSPEEQHMRGWIIKGSIIALGAAVLGAFICQAFLH